MTLGDQVVSSSSSSAPSALAGDKEATVVSALQLDAFEIPEPELDWRSGAESIELQRFEFSETFSFG